MRRLFFPILVVALLALTAYNTQQVAQLRSQVADLQTRVGVLKDASPESAETRSAMDRLAHHLALAREYAAKGDLKRASSELDKSLRIVDSVPEATGDSARNALQDVQRKLRDTSDAIQRIWRQGNGREDGGGKGGA